MTAPKITIAIIWSSVVTLKMIADTMNGCAGRVVIAIIRPAFVSVTIIVSKPVVLRGRSAIFIRANAKWFPIAGITSSARWDLSAIGVPVNA